MGLTTKNEITKKKFIISRLHADGTHSIDPSSKWWPKIQISQNEKKYTSTRKNTFTLVTLQS